MRSGSGAELPPTQAVRDLIVVSVLATVLGPFLIWGMVGTLLAATTVGQRERLAPAFFALCMNCAFVASIGDLAAAAFVHLKNPASFASFGKVVLAAPFTLVSLRPNGSERELVFLGYWDPDQFWSASGCSATRRETGEDAARAVAGSPSESPWRLRSSWS